jgi:hypothetical protein
MQSKQLYPGKYIVGMVASLIIFLAGGWLILAPFALGYQPYGANWVSQTINDFVVGICVAVVALAAFALFFASLFGSLRAAGMLAARPRVLAASFAAAPEQPVAAQSDLDRTLTTLAAALAADLAARRQIGSDQQSSQPVDQAMTRRER